jgi:hypothetical protein
MLGFDQADATWCWDAETKLWHERGTWIAGESRYVVWRPRYYARAFEEHRMLDAAGGSVYRMGLDLQLDVDGLNIRRVRRAPAIINENKRVYYSEFELDIEPGLADPTPTVAAFRMDEPVLGQIDVRTHLDVENDPASRLPFVDITLTDANSVVQTGTTDIFGRLHFDNVNPGVATVDGVKAGLISGTNTVTAVNGEHHDCVVILYTPV